MRTSTPLSWGGGSPPCLPSSERGWLMAQGWHYASPTIDSGGTESLGPLHVFLWFSEANVRSVSVIIQSFFSICLLFDKFSGTYATWIAFQGCHCNNSAATLRLFSALVVRLHGFKHALVKCLEWPTAIRCDKPSCCSRPLVPSFFAPLQRILTTEWRSMELP